jgi:hypothetical protein
MLVGPIVANGLNCWNVENAWQFSKVYPEHVGADNEPTPEYFRWRGAGYDNKWASRYPKGKGTKPLYSLWSGEKLDYIAARKKFTSLFIVTR